MDVEILARYFQILASPTRLAVIRLLSEGRRDVKDLCARVAVPQSNMSNHLACLRWCGLVRATRIGRRQFYELNDSNVAVAIEEFASSVIWPDLAVQLKTCRRLSSPGAEGL